MSPPEDKIVVGKNEAEELPPGWIVEVRRRKTGSKTKTDRFYTDPVSRYVFRSRRDAQRYLKTGQVGRRAIKPKKNECVDVDNKDDRLHIGETEVRRESKEHMSETLRPKEPLDKSKRLAGNNIDSPPPSPSPSLLEPKTSQATPLVGTEVVPSLSYQPERKTRQAKCFSGIRDNPSPALLAQPKTRRATGQAGIEVDSPQPSSPDTRTSHQAKRVRPVNLATPPKVKDNKTEVEKWTENADMDNIPYHKQETNEKQVTTKEHNKEIETGPTNLLSSEDQVRPTLNNPFPQSTYGYEGDMKSNSSNNFSVNDLWTDPCIGVSVKTSPFGDLNVSPSPLEVSLEELWTDPCIEFAVKTLTGAIPVGEDDYLQPQAASSRNPRAPHDLGMSYCQTNALSKPFETGENKPQDLVTPKYGNICFQNSGNVLKGSSGQCSRSRFFQ